MRQCPIVIGGIGGSGTRVVADILRTFHVFIGNDLNTPLDNLSYTFLFKRPKWYHQNFENKKKMVTALSILEKSMINTNSYSISEIAFLVSAIISMSINGHNSEKKGKGRWAFDRFCHILFHRQKERSSYSAWGWKEPNSHLIINHLNNYFPNLKYIYTLRDGLDMAFSDNQQQLYNWGEMFGIKMPASKEKLPQASFSYWVAVNKNILALQKEIGAHKLHILNFDQLCIHPESEIQKLIKFIGIDITENQLQEAISLPVVPASKGRHKNYSISDFKPDDMEFLRSLGF
ncbi:MAG: hypothetical protein GQ527_05720 [Bacteroidales bacterium]|nr:hypothetical protein [Bacteroidales bacterium]